MTENEAARIAAWIAGLPARLTPARANVERHNARKLFPQLSTFELLPLDRELFSRIAS
jgi:hypothetical protein